MQISPGFSSFICTPTVVAFFMADDKGNEDGTHKAWLVIKNEVYCQSKNSTRQTWIGQLFQGYCIRGETPKCSANSVWLKQRAGEVFRKGMGVAIARHLCQLAGRTQEAGDGSQTCSDAPMAVGLFLYHRDWKTGVLASLMALFQWNGYQVLEKDGPSLWSWKEAFKNIYIPKNQRKSQQLQVF